MQMKNSDPNPGVYGKTKVVSFSNVPMVQTHLGILSQIKASKVMPEIALLGNETLNSFIINF